MTILALALVLSFNIGSAGAQAPVLKFHSGFELGDVSEWGSTNGSPSIETIIPYEEYITGEDSGTNIYGVDWVSQNFTPSTSHTVTTVSLLLRRTGSPGTLSVSIRATSGSEPTGSDLCYGTMDGNLITTVAGGDWYEIDLGDGTPVIASTEYAIVARCVDGVPLDRVDWQRDATSPAYGGGSQWLSYDSGGDWTETPDVDGLFVEGDGPHTGDFVLNASSAETYIVSQTFPSVQRTTFYLYIASAPASDCIILHHNSAGTDRPLVMITSLGYLQLEIGTGSDTGSTSLDEDKWYRVCLATDTVAAKVHLDGSEECYVAQVPDHGTSVELGVISNVAANLFFDDVACDDLFSTVDLGDIRVAISKTNTNGTGGLRNTWAGVDETTFKFLNVDDTPATTATYNWYEAANLERWQNLGVHDYFGSDDVFIDERLLVGYDAYAAIYSTTNWEAQTFTPSSDVTIGCVELYLSYSGTPSGDLDVEIWATSGGLPTGGALASGRVVDYNRLNPSYTYYRIGFTDTVSLTGSTKYAIVVHADSANSGNYYRMGLDSTSPSYTNGASCWSDDGGSSWTEDTAYDFMFAVYAVGSMVDSSDTIEAVSTWWYYETQAAGVGEYATTVWDQGDYDDWTIDDPGTPTWINRYDAAKPSGGSWTISALNDFIIGMGCQARNKDIWWYDGYCMIAFIPTYVPPVTPSISNAPADKDFGVVRLSEDYWSSEVFNTAEFETFDDLIMAVPVWGDQWAAQLFTCTTAHTIKYVELSMIRAGSPGLVYASIQGSTAGTPDGTNLSSERILNGSLMETTYLWYTFGFETGAAATSGGAYQIVLRAPNGDSDNKIWWEANLIGATYAGGDLSMSLDGGQGAWTVQTDDDFGFKEGSGDDDPTFALTDAQCHFTVTNDGEVSVDVTISATDFTGGSSTWTLGSTAGTNIVVLSAGQSGDAAETNMVTIATTAQAFMSTLATSGTKKWEIQLDTPVDITVWDGTGVSSTITLTAAAS